MDKGVRGKKDKENDYQVLCSTFAGDDVFLNMLGLLCFPLVLLLGFIWQWFSKYKK